MENELEELKQSRDADRKRNKDKIYELEREVVKEKDRLKKEMDLQLQEARSKMLDIAHSKLEAVGVLNSQLCLIKYRQPKSL